MPAGSAESLSVRFRYSLANSLNRALGSSPSFRALSAASTASWVSLRVLRTPSISLVANSSSLMECRM